MNDLKIGDEVYIRNFENQKLTVSSFDKEKATCIYLNGNREFKSLQITVDLLVQKNFSPVTVATRRSRSNEKTNFREFE